jgi:hypothetical protein
MNRDDPSDYWRSVRGFFQLPPEVVAEQQAETHAGLDRLSNFLDHPPIKWGKFNRAGLGDGHAGVGFATADLPRAQQLYRRVYETRGTGSSSLQKSLLTRMAEAEDPETVPFWLEVLDLSRPRDSFTTNRQTLALAALARLAIVRDVADAYTALREAIRHRNPNVRAVAVSYLSRTYLETQRPFPPDVLADLTDMATHDAAFGPRFRARVILREAELPVPLNNPGGVYAFKVKFMSAKRIFRSIELRSEQTLDTLHFAIQEAISWDADHLYAFYLNGKLYDEQYAFVCPVDEEALFSTDEAVIGELGLVARQKFVYLFDFGDSHQFEVEVVGIHSQKNGKYPRVVESQGKAPRQYHWDDEWEEQ